MKTKKLIHLAFATLAIVVSTVTYADENGNNLIYLGAGPAKTANSVTNGDNPLSLGYLRISNETNAVFGFDISGEGSKLDSTWGRNKSVTQAMSYNLLIGRNFTKDENSRVDGAVLLGMREESANCPSSYLGYQCYANTEPKTNHKLNYGVVLAWSYKSFMVGLRATGQSTQALVGLRF